MIGIICAMHDEVAALLATLENKETTTLGNRTYHTGKIHQQKIVLAFSKWGKVAAAITATQMINSFEITELIFTGVAGSINTHVNVGDIVLGQTFAQHDMDASPIFEPLEIPIIGQKLLATPHNTKLQAAIKKFINQHQQVITDTHLATFNIQNITLHQGLIASGDQFISQANQIAKIKKLLPDTLCVEMEGAAIAQVCYEYKIPFQIIRTISDKADEEAPVDFPKFTKEVASCYAKAILENYCE